MSPQVETLRKLVDETGVEAMRPWARVFSGWLLIRQGHVAEGLAQMRRHLPGHDNSGTNLGAPGLCALLAQLYLDHGYYDEGLQAVDRGLDLHKQGIGQMAKPTLPAAALLFGKDGAGSREEAESLFLRAAGIAREQNAHIGTTRGDGPQAAVAHTDREQEATAHLAEI